MCKKQPSEAIGFSSETPFPLAETEQKVHTLHELCAHFVTVILFDIRSRREVHYTKRP